MRYGRDEVVRHTPEKLLGGFTRSRLFSCLLGAMVMHVLVIGLTSYPYIRDTYIDPEGAVERRKKAKEEEDKRKKAELAAKVREQNKAKEAEAGKKGAVVKKADEKAEPKTGEAKKDEAKKDEAGAKDEKGEYVPDVIKQRSEKLPAPKVDEQKGIGIDEMEH